MDYTNLTQISKLIKNCDAFVPTPYTLVNNDNTRHKKGRCICANYTYPTCLQVSTKIYFIFTFIFYFLSPFYTFRRCICAKSYLFSKSAMYMCLTPGFCYKNLIFVLIFRRCIYAYIRLKLNIYQNLSSQLLLKDKILLKNYHLTV